MELPGLHLLLEHRGRRDGPQSPWTWTLGSLRRGDAVVVRVCLPQLPCQSARSGWCVLMLARCSGEPIDHYSWHS